MHPRAEDGIGRQLILVEAMQCVRLLGRLDVHDGAVEVRDNAAGGRSPVFIAGGMPSTC